MKDRNLSPDVPDPLCAICARPTASCECPECAFCGETGNPRCAKEHSREALWEPYNRYGAHLARTMGQGNSPPQYQCGECGNFVAARSLEQPCPYCSMKKLHEALKQAVCTFGRVRDLCQPGSLAHQYARAGRQHARAVPFETMDHAIPATTCDVSPDLKSLFVDAEARADLAVVQFGLHATVEFTCCRIAEEVGELVQAATSTSKGRDINRAVRIREEAIDVIGMVVRLLREFPDGRVAKAGTESIAEALSSTKVARLTTVMEAALQTLDETHGTLINTQRTGGNVPSDFESMGSGIEEAIDMCASILDTMRGALAQPNKEKEACGSPLNETSCWACKRLGEKGFCIYGKPCPRRKVVRPPSLQKQKEQL